MPGTGFSNSTDTPRAASEALQQALDNAPGSAPVWLLALVGGRHDPEAMVRALAEGSGGLPVYGGSVVGVIGNRVLGYTGYEALVTVFTGEMPAPEVLVVRDLEDREPEVGRELADRTRDAGPDRAALLFYDTVRQRAGEGVNNGSRLLDGFYEASPRERSLVTGAGLLGDFQLYASFVFTGARAERSVATLLLFPEGYRWQSCVMHGCQPASGFMEVTAVDGASILELDGRPAARVVRDLIGDESAIAFSLLFGRKIGDPWAPFDEADYINRLVIGEDSATGALRLFEPDIRTGDRVQMMVRDNETMLDSVRHRTWELLSRVDGGRIRFGLYMDCAGRAGASTGCEIEEASVVQELLGDRIPLAGGYVGREIGDYLGRSRPLDWTGVLSLLVEEQ